MLSTQLNLARIILIGICLLLLVVGCQPVAHKDDEGVIVTETISNEQVATLQDITPLTSTSPIIQSETATWTPIPSQTDFATPQSTPTSVSTEAVMPTLWPTLSPDEATSKVLSLLADNQNPNCLLPCWWGAMPGETQWWSIQPYLQSFSLQTYPYPQDSLYVVVFPIPSSVSGLGELHIGYTLNALDIINSIDVPSINIEGYDPQTMMTLYGIPDEVWVKSLDEPREGVLPFQLVIVYQQRGISFRYYVDAARTGDMVIACFEPGIELERPDLFPAGPRIYVWEPGQHKEIEEISPIPGETYFPLELKTDLTLQTLYERFTNPDEQPCIDTPVDAWR